MKINDQQIDQLYIFTRKHYVEYYDVQTELVDHLANDIEKIWEEKPQLTFEQARDVSFKKFGVFGFMDVVESKHNQMQKNYAKTVMSFVKDWFRLPKVIVTIALIYFFFFIQQFTWAPLVYTVVFFSVLFVESIVMIRNKRKLKKKQQQTGKKWLFETILLNQGIGSLILICIYSFNFLFPDHFSFGESGFLARLFAAFSISFLLILACIVTYVIPKKASELLENKYPEYSIS